MGDLKKDTPGLLVKYKKSKAKDDFGREGKGEVISSRIAIYRGIKQGDKQSVFVVENTDTGPSPCVGYSILSE